MGAPDDGHEVQDTESSCAEVVGMETPDEAPEVSLEHWVQVAGADTTDEAPDDEHQGASMAAVTDIPD